ncbi:MAG: sigma-70 family RNA polymerase sigma factor [Planctomycetes bacterium]|nr:sigma-70 family RNA polymerase sigma factor [Planctomycetota bacterium]
MDLSRETDQDLVARVLKGDQVAFEAIVERFRNQVYGLALRKVSDVAVAQDITQDTFVIGYENISRLKAHDRLKSWLMGIAANLIRDYYKRRKVAGLSEEMDVPALPSDPLDGLEQRELHELLHKALAQLSERYRAVLIKRYLEGLDYPQIAEELGLSVGAVEVCMHRARKNLAAALKDYTPELE